MRQREDAWVRERERLCAEIENHQQANVEANERYRELEMKNEALEEQNNRLVLEARAATSAPEWAQLVDGESRPTTLSYDNVGRSLSVPVSARDERRNRR